MNISSFAPQSVTFGARGPQKDFLPEKMDSRSQAEIKGLADSDKVSVLLVINEQLSSRQKSFIQKQKGNVIEDLSVATAETTIANLRKIASFDGVSNIEVSGVVRAI